MKKLRTNEEVRINLRMYEGRLVPYRLVPAELRNDSDNMIIWMTEAVISVLAEIVDVPPDKRNEFLSEKLRGLAKEIRHEIGVVGIFSGTKFFKLPKREQERKIRLKWRATASSWLAGNNVFTEDVHGG